jgi:hypothetical protein
VTKALALLAVLPLALSLPSCASSGATTPASPLQVREYQSRTYETGDTKLVMKAVLNTLQDEGFTVRSADSELGLLTAVRETNVGRKIDGLLTLMTYRGFHYRKLSVVEATANVSPFGSQTRVRLSFQRRTLDDKGVTVKVEPVSEAEFYQAFLAAVDKAVFIEKEKL